MKENEHTVTMQRLVLALFLFDLAAIFYCFCTTNYQTLQCLYV